MVECLKRLMLRPVFTGGKTTASSLACGVALLALVAASRPLSAAAGEALPDQIDTAASVRLWISAQAAQDERGNLRPDLFSKETRWVFERNSKALDKERLEASAEPGARPEAGSFAADCPGWSDADVSERAGRKRGLTAEELVRSSIAILRGRVVGSEYGFWGEEPSLLVALSVEDTLLSSPQVTTSGGVLYFYYPYAHFSVGDLHFCKKPTRTPARPEEGDEVLLFVFYPPRDRDHRLVESDHEEVIFEAKGGALSLPSKLAQDPELLGKDDIDHVQRLVQRILASEAGK
jgi:hypothetical protein